MVEGYILVYRKGRTQIVNLSELEVMIADTVETLWYVRAHALEQGAEERPDLMSELYQRIEGLREVLGLPPEE